MDNSIRELRDAGPSNEGIRDPSTRRKGKSRGTKNDKYRHDTKCIRTGSLSRSVNKEGILTPWLNDGVACLEPLIVHSAVKEETNVTTDIFPPSTSTSTIEVPPENDMLQVVDEMRTLEETCAKSVAVVNTTPEHTVTPSGNHTTTSERIVTPSGNHTRSVQLLDRIVNLVTEIERDDLVRYSFEHFFPNWKSKLQRLTTSLSFPGPSADKITRYRFEHFFPNWKNELKLDASEINLVRIPDFDSQSDCEQQTPEGTIPEQKPEGMIPEQQKPEEMIPEQQKPEGTIPEQQKPEGTIPEQQKPEGTIPEQQKPEGTIPEQQKPEETIPEQQKPEETIQEQQKPEETIQEQRKPEGTVHGAGCSDIVSNIEDTAALLGIDPANDSDTVEIIESTEHAKLIVIDEEGSEDAQPQIVDDVEVGPKVSLKCTEIGNVDQILGTKDLRIVTKKLTVDDIVAINKKLRREERLKKKKKHKKKREKDQLRGIIDAFRNNHGDGVAEGEGSSSRCPETGEWRYQKPRRQQGEKQKRKRKHREEVRQQRVLYDTDSDSDDNFEKFLSKESEDVVEKKKRKWVYENEIDEISDFVVSESEPLVYEDDEVENMKLQEKQQKRLFVPGGERNRSESVMANRTNERLCDSEQRRSCHSHGVEIKQRHEDNIKKNSNRPKVKTRNLNGKLEKKKHKWLYENEIDEISDFVVSESEPLVYEDNKVESPKLVEKQQKKLSVAGGERNRSKSVMVNRTNERLCEISDNEQRRSSHSHKVEIKQKHEDSIEKKSKRLKVNTGNLNGKVHEEQKRPQKTEKRSSTSKSGDNGNLIAGKNVSVGQRLGLIDMFKKGEMKLQRWKQKSRRKSTH